MIDQVGQSLEAAEELPRELPGVEGLAAEAEMQVVAAEMLAGEMSVAVAGLARRQQCSRQLVGQILWARWDRHLLSIERLVIRFLIEGWRHHVLVERWSRHCRNRPLRCSRNLSGGSSRG